MKSAYHTTQDQVSSRWEDWTNQLTRVLQQAELQKIWPLSLFSTVYFAATLMIASRRLMWNDELYTYYITRLPTLSDVWGALSTGTEQLPPFFYLIMRETFTLFGTNQISIRLPEAVGFWTMCLCIFLFVARRSSTLCGLLAMVFPLVTSAYYYAYEARPYGLLLGFSAFSLLSWQSVALDRRRALWMMCLVVGLAATVSIHYYGILIVVPLAVGELCRSLKLRRFDFSVWIALALAPLPLILYLPLVRQGMTHAGQFWSRAYWGAIPYFYNDLLASAVLPLAIVVMFSSVYGARGACQHYPKVRAVEQKPEIYEIAAAFGFFLIPVLAVSLGEFVTGAFTSRYALPAVIGVSILIAFGVDRLWRSWEPLLVLILCCCVAFTLRTVQTVREIGWDTDKLNGVQSFLQSHTDNEVQIAISDAHLFFLLAHYARPQIAQRIVYLADTDASRRYLGFDSPEQGMVRLLKPWFHLRVEAYEPYIASHERFFVFGPVDVGRYSLNWVLADLVVRRREVEFKARAEGNLLFLAISTQPNS